MVGEKGARTNQVEASFITYIPQVRYMQARAWSWVVILWRGRKKSEGLAVKGRQQAPARVYYIDVQERICSRLGKGTAPDAKSFTAERHSFPYPHDSTVEGRPVTIRDRAT